MKVITNKYRLNIFALVLCSILICTIVTACTSEIEEFNGDYAIIYTNVFKTQGGIIDMDSNGGIISKEAIEMQDILFVDNSDDYVIVSGHRRNNNIVYDTKGSKKEVFLLNNPKYTGVTAVELYGDKITAIMNGNVSEGIYKTLLVIQDMEDKVLHEEIIEMYPRDLAIDNQTLYIGGNSKRPNVGEWDSKIMKFDLVENEFVGEQTDDSLYNFSKLQLLDNDIYALTEDKNFNPKLISIIDKNNLTIKKQQSFDKNIIDIYIYNKYLYVLCEDMVYKYDKDFNIIESQELWTDSDYFVSYNSFFNNELYLFIKSQNKEVLSNNKKMVGKIVRISLDNVDNIEYTDFIVDDSKNKENIVFFPTSFFEK